MPVNDLTRKRANLSRHGITWESMMYLAFSYDHRLIDGADAARFLRWIAEAFEQPFLLSVQG